MLCKNCDHFVPYVARDVFMETLKKNIPKRFYLQQVIQMKSHPDLLEAERIDKTLVLFLNLSKVEKYPIFKRYYEKLVAKGIKFPEVLEDEQLIIGKPKHTPTLGDLKKPAPSQDKKGKTKTDAPIRDVEVTVTDGECKTYMDHAKMLCELLTESAPSANLQTDEIIQQVLRSVKQGNTTIGLRLGGEGQPQIMSQLMVSYEELAHAQDYYTGLLNGKAIRSHNKSDRFRTGPKSPESPLSGPVPEQDMNKLTEQQQLALAMKESIKLQQDQEEKRKKEAADAEQKAKREQEEKKKSQSNGFDDLFNFNNETPQSTPPQKTQKQSAKPTTSAPSADLFDLSFLDQPQSTSNTKSTPLTIVSNPTHSAPFSTASTATTSTDGGRSPFDDNDDEEQPGTEGKEDDSSEDEGGTEGFDPFAELAHRHDSTTTAPAKKTPKPTQTIPQKQQQTSTEVNDPFLALANRHEEDDD